MVEELVLDVVDAGAVDLALAVDQSWREEQARFNQHRREKRQRLEYEAALAQQRYELVDPANRLVAQTLETAWNERLVALEAIRTEEEQRQRPLPPASTPEQMRDTLAQLRKQWHGGRLASQDKKEVLRCVLEQVRLATDGKVIRAEVVWQGGARSHLEVPKYLGVVSAAYHQILTLAQAHPDAEIAAQLNADGLLTMKGKAWTARRVMDFRLSNAIPSGLTASPTMRRSDAAYLTSGEVAERLGVHQTRVQHWFHLGLLKGRQAGRQRQLWIAWDAEIAQRLDGTAPIDGRMVSVRRLCAAQSKHPDEILAWAVAEGHTNYRVRRGTVFRFYILPYQAEHCAG